MRDDSAPPAPRQRSPGEMTMPEEPRALSNREILIAIDEFANRESKESAAPTQIDLQELKPLFHAVRMLIDSVAQVNPSKEDKLSTIESAIARIE